MAGISPAGLSPLSTALTVWSRAAASSRLSPATAIAPDHDAVEEQRAGGAGHVIAEQCERMGEPWPLPLLDRTPATPTTTAATRMTSPIIMMMPHSGESESQISVTEGSPELSRIKKTPVPTAVPADIAEAQLPGSGATPLFYAPAGSRATGHPGAGVKDRLPRVLAHPGRRTGRPAGSSRRPRPRPVSSSPPGRRRPRTLGARWPCSPVRPIGNDPCGAHNCLLGLPARTRKLRAVRRPAIFAGAVFLFGSAPLRRCGSVKGKSPLELISPTAICRAGPATPYVNSLLTKESVMGIIAWIVLGL